MELPQQTHVSLLVVIRRNRVLPTRGAITARVNQKVSPAETVGRTTLAPSHYLFDIAHGLGLAPAQADKFLRREPGERVTGGDILAGPVGWMRRVVRAPEEGKVIIQGDGRLLYEGLGEAYELRAGLPGSVIGIEPDVSVTVETAGALVEGIWGNDKQDFGGLAMAPAGNSAPVSPDELNFDMRGTILVAGRLEDPNTLHSMASLQVKGLIVGSMPAALIPAANECTFPIVLTEGFGRIPMNTAAFEIFSTNIGREANLNAQVADPWRGSRPEAIIPLPAVGSADVPSDSLQLVAGRRVRVLRAPYFGQVGTVVSVPEGLLPLPSGVRVSCAEIELGEAGLARVPIANLDILE